jgi:hypothetical protein
MSATVIRSLFRLAPLVGLCALATPALAAENIVLMPLELSSGLEGSRADLEGAVLKGLAVAGRPVAPPADSATTRGTYAVSGSLGREGNNFTASFRLVRTADRATLGTQENHCDMVDCAVAELARRSARELVRQTLGRPGEEPAPPAPAPVKAPPPPTDSGSGRPTALGVTALVAGAAAIGVGIYLVTIHDKCRDPKPLQTCKEFNNTRVGGIASIAGGVAAGALGVYLLVHDDSKTGGTTVAVGVRPSGLVFAGRF